VTINSWEKLQSTPSIHIDQKEEKENAKSALPWIFVFTKAWILCLSGPGTCVSLPCLVEGSYLFDILLSFKHKLIITHQIKLKLVKKLLVIILYTLHATSKSKLCVSSLTIFHSVSKYHKFNRW